MWRRCGRRSGAIPRRWRSPWTRRPRWPWATTLAGGKTRTDAHGDVTKGWDHDPPAKARLVPFGILLLASGALMLRFGSRETSDAWVDALQFWWRQVRSGLGHIKRLVIYLDNGPKNSGRRTQFLKRVVQFADWSGLEIRLVYYPPYHSKYNPIERCWSALEQKWNGVLLNCLKVVLQCALRMTWKGRHPTVKRLYGVYPDGVRVAAQEMKQYEARLQRSATLPKYDILIKPRVAESGRVPKLLQCDQPQSSVRFASDGRPPWNWPGRVTPMDDLTRFCCQNAACAFHGRRDAGNLCVYDRYGTHQQIRLLYCKACKARFSERKGTPLFYSGLPSEKALSVLQHLVEGNGVRQTERLVGVHRDTVMRLGRLAGTHARDSHEELVAFSPRDPRSPAR